MCAGWDWPSRVKDEIHANEWDMEEEGRTDRFCPFADMLLVCHRLGFPLQKCAEFGPVPAVEKYQCLWISYSSKFLNIQIKGPIVSYHYEFRMASPLLSRDCHLRASIRKLAPVKKLHLRESVKQPNLGRYSTNPSNLSPSTSPRLLSSEQDDLVTGFSPSPLKPRSLLPKNRRRAHQPFEVFSFPPCHFHYFTIRTELGTRPASFRVFAKSMLPSKVLRGKLVVKLDTASPVSASSA